MRTGRKERAPSAVDIVLSDFRLTRVTSKPMTMKKALILLSVLTIAAVTSVQAGEKSAKTKNASATAAKASCCSTETSCSSVTAAQASSCCAATKMAKKWSMNVKGAVNLASR